MYEQVSDDCICFCLFFEAGAPKGNGIEHKSLLMFALKKKKKDAG